MYKGSVLALEAMENKNLSSPYNRLIAYSMGIADVGSGVVFISKEEFDTLRNNEMFIQVLGAIT